MLLLVLLTLLDACQIHLWDPNPEDQSDLQVTVERYDRLQSRYLTHGDLSALQTMNTDFPMETRALLENVLQLGTVDQADINDRFLKFYQDTTLQHIIRDVDMQYAHMDDINTLLTQSFLRLQGMFPHMHVPQVYTQIGALGQSIIVGDSIVGISLDKYLGSDYPIYARYYSEHQRESMNRDHIVPDCLLFYLISLYPLQNFERCPQDVRDTHIGRIMHCVNMAMDRRFYTMPHVVKAEHYKQRNPHLTWEGFLTSE